MNVKLWIIAICSILIYNIYYENNIFAKLKQYKKYYKMAVIVIMGIGAMSIVNRSPKMGVENLDTLNSFIKTMPIDRGSRDLLTPFLSSSNGGDNLPVKTNYEKSCERIQRSGGKSTKRCVSETKKKYVASQQNWVCNKCKNKLNHTFEVDHVIRLENGGTNEVTNLEALCRECHGQKTAFENF